MKYWWSRADQSWDTCLPKLNRDYFSDGNLEVTLVKTSYDIAPGESVTLKSIQVEHRNAGLSASLYNGHCKVKQLDSSVDGTNGTQLGDGATVDDLQFLTGTWINGSEPTSVDSFGESGKLTIRDLRHDWETVASLVMDWVESVNLLLIWVDGYLGERLNRQYRVAKYRAFNKRYFDPYDPANYTSPLRAKNTAVARAGNAIMLFLDVLSFIHEYQLNTIV